MTDEIADKPRGGAETTYKVLVRHLYKSKGVDQVRWSNVGVAFPSRNGDGFNILIADGIAVSGQIYLRPFDPKADGPAFDYVPFNDPIR